MGRFLFLLAVILGAGGLLFWWSHSDANQETPKDYWQSYQPKLTVSSPEPTAAVSVAALKGVGPSLGRHRFYDPVVVTACNLAPILEQDVSSQVDGVFQEIRTDLGHKVNPGDLLGRLDDRQLLAQVELLQIRAASVATERIAKAQHDEADSKVRYALKANESGIRSVPELEFKTYVFQRERYAQEMNKGREEQETARKELDKAKILLDLHEIRSGLAGEVTKVFKRNGEAVKQGEALFRVANFNRLRIEGLCKVQQADLIRVGSRALVEPELRGEQMTELTGHTGAITGLALSADGRWLASASEDRTVVLWSWPDGARRAVFTHPGEVYGVIWAPLNQGGQRLLTGCSDGQARLWTISPQGEVLDPLVCAQAHESAIRAVAFDPAGKWCATGGEDKRIAVWDAASGKRLYWLHQDDESSSAHFGAVTSLHFTPDGHLVSAGRDNSLKVWQVDDSEGRLVGQHRGRSGDATQLNLSPDGRSVLFDHGEELRILDRTSGATMGSLKSNRQGRFHQLALFSPSGKLILAGANNGRLQLWKVPATPEAIQFFRNGYAEGFERSSLRALGQLALGTPLPGMAAGPIWGDGAKSGAYLPHLWSLHAFEVRQFLAPAAAVVHCAAFAPDESVFFTGGTDKVIRVWGVPPESQWNQPLEAQITFVAEQVERGTNMVRIRAEMPNSEDLRRLRTGIYASLVVYPEASRVNGKGTD